MKLASGILGFTLTSIVALASASAADMYAGPSGYKDAPVYTNWAGFYGGVNGGGAGSDSSDKFALASSGFGGMSPSGAFYGVQIGYNWQGMWHPNLVLGVEADIQGGGADHKDTDAFGNVFKSRLDWFDTIRGRLGYAYGPSLLYATGGFVSGKMRNDAISAGVTDFKFDGTATGYTLGGGLEYKLSPGWGVKVEYLYINLGRNDPTFAGVSACGLGPKCEEDAFHTGRVGLNYHIAPGYEPLK